MRLFGIVILKGNMTIKIRQDGLYEIIHPPGSILSYGFDWTRNYSRIFSNKYMWAIDPSLTLTSLVLMETSQVCL